MSDQLGVGQPYNRADFLKASDRELASELEAANSYGRKTVSLYVVTLCLLINMTPLLKDEVLALCERIPAIDRGVDKAMRIIFAGIFLQDVCTPL